MVSGQIVVICVAAACLHWGGRAVGHGVKVGAIKTEHAIVRVVTLGHHPKAKEAK